MTLLFYKTLAALIIFAIGVITAILPLRKKYVPTEQVESAEIGEALASGIFMGTAFFHMLPDSIKLFDHLYGSLVYPVPELICVFGFILLLFLERLSLTKTKLGSKHSIPYILSLILIIHALTEGAALGIGETYSETIMLLIAIIAHKGSESFALCTILLRHELPFKQIIFIVVFFALMTPLGILGGAGINLLALTNHGELIAAIFNAFAAGTFLYISTLHHVHFHKHAHDERQGLLEFFSLVAGVIAMGAIALWT